MNNPPYFYDYTNTATSMVNPSTIHIHDTAVFNYYTRYLLEDAVSIVKPYFPPEWAENMVMFSIFCNGGVCVFDSSEFGLVSLPATLGGYTVYYAPAFCQVVNPLIKGNKRFIIGKECAYIHLQPNYCGIMDIVYYYASKLALVDESLHMNLSNSKLAYVFFADNKSTAETLKKLYDQMQEGNPAVVYDKSVNLEENQKPWEIFTQNLSGNFIAQQILDAKQTIINEFHTTIGVPNSNVTKRERLITAEAESNNVATFCKPELWLETLNKSAEDVKRLFGVDVYFERRFQGGEDYGKSNPIDSGTL